MTANQQLVEDISCRISELTALSHVLEALFVNNNSLLMLQKVFNGPSLFSMQYRMCEELSSLNDKLALNLERGME